MSLEESNLERFADREGQASMPIPNHNQFLNNPLFTGRVIHADLRPRDIIINRAVNGFTITYGDERYVATSWKQVRRIMTVFSDNFGKMIEKPAPDRGEQCPTETA